MTSTERTVLHIMSHELVIEKDKCIIQVTVYNNEDLKIVLEDLTSKDIFQYDKDAMAIEIFTAKCKAAMTGLEFYNLMECVFESTANSNSYKCHSQNGDMVLTFSVNIPMARGKNLVRTFDLTLIKQEQKDVDRVIKIVHDINRDKDAIMNTRALIDKLPKMIECVKIDFECDLDKLRFLLREHKNIVDKLNVDVAALTTQSAKNDVSELHNILEYIQSEYQGNMDLVRTKIDNTLALIKTSDEQFNTKLTQVTGDITATKSSLDNINVKIETANREIAKLQNTKPSIEFLTLAAPLAFATDINLGQYNKQYTNSNLFIEAYLSVAGSNGVVPSASFVCGGLINQAQYITQVSSGPLTTLTFIGRLVGNTSTGDQALAIRFKAAPFVTLNPNETHCPGSGCGQTISNVKITEIPR